ncbi:MAG: hypothetical protein CSB44_03060 [Gammaproteobacteria bacterium]|nr:MAG: hypothetical protein CSB44_03060 [Gammaproteobacteria bacterium]
MMTTTNNNDRVAVLTGDLVRSSRLSPEALDDVRHELQRAVADIADWTPGFVPHEADFFRGDAWQLLLQEPTLALRATIFLRARLIAIGRDARIGIGIGAMDAASAKRVSLASGPAFLRSGHALDRLGSGRLMLIVDSDERPGAQPDWPNVTLELVEALLMRLTRRQAQLLALALHPQRRTHEMIARLLEPTVERQVVSKTLSRAGHGAIETAILAFEQAYH